MDSIKKLVELLAVVVQFLRRIMFSGCEKDKNDETKKNE